MRSSFCSSLKMNEIRNLRVFYVPHQRHILCVSRMKNLKLKGAFFLLSSYQFFISVFLVSDLSLGSFRKGKDKIHHGSHNNLHDVTTTTNPFHFYTNPKWYESYFDPIIPRNVSSISIIIVTNMNSGNHHFLSLFSLHRSQRLSGNRPI
jgi:hypothetical protein